MTKRNIFIDSSQSSWYQGCLLTAVSARASWLIHDFNEEMPREDLIISIDTPNLWKVEESFLDENDYLVIVSQTCDIRRPSLKEPYVEAVRAFITSDKGTINDVTTSGRLFLLRRVSIDGSEEALVADATMRVHIAKDDLLKLTPLFCFEDDDKVTPRMFRQWLAKRYNRQAVPDSIADAVQKPIVKSIQKLGKTNDLHRVFNGIWEIRFFLRNDSKPYQVVMLFLRSERNDAPSVGDEDAAKLGNWIEQTLQKAGDAELVSWDILGTKNISLYTYLNTYELHRDFYTLTEDASREH